MDRKDQGSFWSAAALARFRAMLSAAFPANRHYPPPPVDSGIQTNTLT
jgi:hypothetical protein